MDEASIAALAARGYDVVDTGDDSDSDGGLPGRIRPLDPAVAKEKGKAAFAKGKYDKAIKAWQGGLKSILSALCSGPEALGNQTLSELDLTLNLNIAMAHMKKGDYDSADSSVDKALARREALPPQLICKALYRKASAQRAMHRLEECLATLQDLLEVEEANAAAKQMKQEVEREWAKQCRTQKNNLKKMFSKLGDEDKEIAEKERREQSEARSACGVVWIDGEDVDSLAFSRGDTPCCDGADWGLALSRTVLWAIEEIAVHGNPCMAQGDNSLTIWFVGASSTCELRHLQPTSMLERLPGVYRLELVLIGFLGELDPDNKRIPDPKLDSLPQEDVETVLPDGRRAIVRVVQGTLQEALEGGLGAGLERSESAAAVSPPSICFIPHPQLHRYFSDLFPAVSWLITTKVPTIVIGASEPDPSWEQDETLLKALGTTLIMNKKVSPYPMCLPDNPKVKKCSHIIGFLGGKAVAKENLTKVKLELLSQDYSVR